MNIPERIRVGVVGTSAYTDRRHLAGLHSHPRAYTAAICGRNRARAEEMAAKYAIPAVFTDYRAMLDRARLDAVVVSTPDDLHYPVVMAALDAGLHVACEKPLAMSAQLAREMYDRAEALGVRHLVFFTFRWLPNPRTLHQLIASGYLGRCFDCSIQYLAEFAREPRYLWRFDRRHGNGALGDIGPHMIDLARWYVGDITRVSASLSTHIERPGEAGQPFAPANDSAFVLVEFENGAHGAIHLSAVAHVGERSQEQHIVLHGSAGTLEAHWTRIGGEIRGARNDEQAFPILSAGDDVYENIDPSRPTDVFLRQPAGVRLFIDGIVEDRPVSPNFYDGWKVQQVVDAALRSAEEGRWVSV